MIKLDIRRQPPTIGKPIYKHEYERTAFDYTIIVLAYVFAPLGLILAILRSLSTHSKIQRKASNYNLLYHACMGVFIQLGIYFVVAKIMGEFGYVALLIRLVIIYALFRISAIKFSVKAKGKKEGFTQLCNDYIALILVDGIRHIGSLSDIRGYSEADVRKHLEYLIDQGLLDPDIMYYEGRVDNPFVKLPPKLVRSEQTPSSGGIKSRNNSEQPPSKVQTKPKPQPSKVILCSGCGAQNKVLAGQFKECEYCGTTIAYS
ncbi:MAG TPA: hypothetical protein VGN87_17055 [Paenibacillus sp.]|jgi:hypothetical protein